MTRNVDRFAHWLHRTVARLNRISARAQVMADEREHAYAYALDLQERYRRLLGRNGLEHLIARETFGDFYDVPSEQGYLLLVPLLEAQQKRIDSLENRVIWGDEVGRG